MTNTELQISTKSPAVKLADVARANGGIYPGFAFLRHMLAITILMHHARIAVRGERLVPAITGHEGLSSLLFSAEAFRPILFALVGSFFALSGFLVAGSAIRTSDMRIFLSFRALRIFPALISEVALSAFILGPLVTAWPLSQYFSSELLYRYFGNIVGHITFFLPGVFTDNPIKDVVNANLWTLQPEFYCYLLMAAGMFFRMFNFRKAMLVAFCLVTVTVLILSNDAVGVLATRANNTHFASWFIVYLFFCGVVAFSFSELIPLNPYLFAVSGILYVLGMLAHTPDVISGLLLVYCTVCIGGIRFDRFAFLNKYDYSYGIYLYGHPIAQTIVHMLIVLGLYQSNLKITIFVMVLTLVLTLAFSAASWVLVEKPFLGLKRFVAKRKAA